MQTTIEKILQKKGPLISSELIRDLSKSRAVSAGNARQYLARAKPPVLRLPNIIYKHNQRLYYLERQAGNSDFRHLIEESFSKGALAYQVAVQALHSRDGLIPNCYIKSSLGSPTVSLKGHLKLFTVIRNLESNNLITIEDDLRFGKIITLYENSRDYQTMRILFNVETYVLNSVSDWARRLGLTSWQQQNIRSEKKSPPFGGFEWDYTAPCYLNSIAKKKKGKLEPGFFVANINLDIEMNENLLQAFIHKVNVCRNRKGVRPFIPCFICNNINQGGISALRNNNILVGLLSNIHDAKVNELLNDLVRTLKNAAAVAASNPDKIIDLLEGLSKVEGNAINLRGDLFEMIAGHYYSNQGMSVDIGRKFRVLEDEKTGEIDVFARKGLTSVTIIECKGYSKNKVTEQEIEEWLNKKIPLVRKWLATQELVSQVHKFEFWTTGNFEEKAEELLRKAKSQTRRYTVDYFDGAGVVKKLSDAKLNNLSRKLREHYRINC